MSTLLQKRAMLVSHMLFLLHIAKGHSIYIRNLPLDATVVLVSEEFARFGPINDGGVQVKTHKVHFRICWYIQQIILILLSSTVYL